MQIEVGNEYKRSQLHDALGGNRQGGIASCAKADIVFLFTGETGEQYGYSDGWDGDYFIYTGEGQTGDMAFARGNAAVRDHEQNGKRLILMQTTQRTFVKVVGEFACVDYEYSILRGLEIGKQLGFAYMLIESEKDSSRTKTTTGTVADNKVSVYGTVYGSREKTYKKTIAGATLRVRFFDQKPKGRYLEDKLFPIFSSVVELRHKYGLDN